MFENEGTQYQGTWYFALDRKGRIVIPAPFREIAGEKVILTRGNEYQKPCILAWDPSTWELLTTRYAGDPYFHHFYLGSAKPQTVDKTTGRVLLPWELREWGGIKLRAEPVDLAVTGIGPAIRIVHKHELEQELNQLGGLVPTLEAGTLKPGALPSRPTPALPGQTHGKLQPADNGAVLVAAAPRPKRTPPPGASRAA